MFKKIVFISLVSAIIIVSTIMVVGFLGKQNNTKQPSNNTNSATPASNTETAKPSSQSGSSQGSKTYTISDVAKRNTESNCWLIINNKVYDVTSYINQHPGGAIRITDYCGKEATQAFATQGGEGQHSPNTSSILNTYLIGIIN